MPRPFARLPAVAIAAAACGLAAAPASGQTCPGLYCVPTPTPQPKPKATNGNDVIRGTLGPDTIAALGGNDRVDALAGDDTVFGGAGKDRLLGRAGADSDVVHVRGGGRDGVRCGTGADLVLADRRDRVAKDCETVRRG